MRDIFTLITEQIVRDCGGRPICAHVGDVRVCTIKRHPTYEVLRESIQLGRTKSTKSMRLWESVSTLAMQGEQRVREKWLMILLDMLTPNFRWWSNDLARKWRCDVSDVRSAMVEGALEAWVSLAGSATPRELLDGMRRSAFAKARSLVEVGKGERCAESSGYLISGVVHEEYVTLCASSIIDGCAVQDPDADERIRGENAGALLQRMGAMVHVNYFHEGVRSGRRRDADAPPINSAQLGRTWVDGRNLYYRISDLLPRYIGFGEAADAVGISESQASNMHRKGKLPFSVLWIGNSRVVSVRSLMAVLGVQDSIVHPDDVENGAYHVLRE